MAVRADFNSYNDGYTFLDFYPDERRLRVTDDPEVPGYDHPFSVSFYWDGDKLEHGQREFVGIEIADIRRLHDEDLRAVAYLDLPLVDIPERGLYKVSVADVLRKARDRTLVSTVD
ncbi:hypothetical protein BH20CHL1_BH20CHL1_00780 [soil metagenome]|jgi:hypothetical protein|nr:hypothetical protein [Chloroflexia bacterium]